MCYKHIKIVKSCVKSDHSAIDAYNGMVPKVALGKTSTLRTFRKTVSITSNESGYMSSELKACLRRKNKLLRPGLVEEPNALPVRIGQSIVRFNSTQFKHLDAHVDAKDV